ncbi:MAG: hypothetical protein KAU62_05235 [Candidatus Heimdallarchaeota archaeon]|nr:hypothetical protein [Candidatus Heimdallarchaeota archaeon]MCG3255469.1 hypothetical protein [Candidatus Heimdallarchaeota archaeon]MCK4610543.1 hypothetical protein [Candidatus Heimdallarchaeota archaeon]
MFKLREYEPPLRIQITIKNLFIFMAYFLTLTFFLAIAYYPEKYHFFSEHISNLGRIESFLGSSNTTSMIIIMVGFSLCAALFLTVTILYFLNRKLYMWHVKGVLSLITTFGIACDAIPSDHPKLKVLHIIGASSFIGGFAAFNAFVQISSLVKKKKDKQKEISKVDTIWDIFFSIIVIVLLIGYFVIFALDTSNIDISLIDPIFQKIIIFAEILALYLIDNVDI